MMMSFFLHDSLDDGSFEPIRTPSRVPPAVAGAPREETRILHEKLKIPQTGRTIARPRLDDLLEKSLSQFCGTLVSGRAGTGKTVLAADFARQRGCAGWYTIESSDSDWAAFSAHFAACVREAAGQRSERPAVTGGTDTEIAQFLVGTFAPVAAKANKQFLIVLDDLHKIFDAEWFGRFFHLLLYSVPENCRLLLLCRSKPPGPLWRLRSKQVLNVIDEKLLAFSPEETHKFLGRGVSAADAAKAHTESFGRISKLLQLAGRDLAD